MLEQESEDADDDGDDDGSGGDGGRGGSRRELLERVVAKMLDLAMSPATHVEAHFHLARFLRRGKHLAEHRALLMDKLASRWVVNLLKRGVFAFNVQSSFVMTILAITIFPGQTKLLLHEN